MAIRQQKGMYITVVGNCVNHYIDPLTNSLRKDKIEATQNGVSFKCFKLTPKGKDGFFVNANNSEPKYFETFREAQIYGIKTKERFEITECKEVVI